MILERGVMDFPTLFGRYVSSVGEFWGNSGINLLSILFYPLYNSGCFFVRAYTEKPPYTYRPVGIFLKRLIGSVGTGYRYFSIITIFKKFVLDCG